MLTAPEIRGREGNRVIVRLPRNSFADIEPSLSDAVVRTVTREYVDVLISPTVERGISDGHPLFNDSALLAGAAIIAELREQYIWDVDIAIAQGTDATPEAIREWRRRHRTPTPREDWPADWRHVPVHRIQRARDRVEQIVGSR